MPNPIRQMNIYGGASFLPWKQLIFDSRIQVINGGITTEMIAFAAERQLC
jgi:hypothetical protein